MSHTNSTTNYGLPQWIGSDKPTFLGDFNSAFNTIDGQMKQNSTDAGQAISTANAANATAIDAAERSITAKSTADTAKDTADAANALATTASNTATVAKNTADASARTAEANNIGNLAPAYDPTLTYNVGDLVTYIDENNSGKLYKCIVAWETPGAFNINYWDDVTVSEVLGFTVLASVDADNVKTIGEICGELGAAISSISAETFYKTKLIVVSGTNYYIFNPARISANDFTYDRYTSGINPPGMEFTQRYLNKNGTSSQQREVKIAHTSAQDPTVVLTLTYTTTDVINNQTYMIVA